MTPVHDHAPPFNVAGDEFLCTLGSGGKKLPGGNHRLASLAQGRPLTCYVCIMILKGVRGLLGAYPAHKELLEVSTRGHEL